MQLVVTQALTFSALATTGVFYSVHWPFPECHERTHIVYSLMRSFTLNPMHLRFLCDRLVSVVVSSFLLLSSISLYEYRIIHLFIVQPGYLVIMNKSALYTGFCMLIPFPFFWVNSWECSVFGFM